MRQSQSAWTRSLQQLFREQKKRIMSATAQASPSPLREVVKLSNELSLYERAITIRSVEQKLLDLFAEGKLVGTVHTCIGQEFVGIAVCEALGPGDLIYSNHRCHGHFLARTDDVSGLLAEVMGKPSGVCGGRGGSQHLCSKGFFSNGIQGGIVPVAAGLALTLKLRQPENIGVVFIGDGTLGEGVIYETMNIISKWQLPLLIVLENNLYAQSTSQTQTLAGDICARAAAFGIETTRSSTCKPERLLQASKQCVDRVRKEGRPHFLCIDTARLMAHSKGDDNRDKREVDQYWAKDPIRNFVKQHPDEAGQIEAQAKRRIDAAVAELEVEDVPAPAITGEDPITISPCQWQPSVIDSDERMVSLLYSCFQCNLKADARIVMIGEDIEGPYGGAFKVTKTLSQEFPGRVRNTPISEATIVGLGNGLALGGMLPVVEIMFGDFLTLAADQIINHAAKFRFMYNDQVTVPLVIRTPMGGRRGYGPTHSQSIEKHFLGLPDTMMLALHSRVDPGFIYDRLFATIDRPTIVIENKLLYGMRLSEKVAPGFVLEHTNERFPTTRLRPETTPHLTIVCYGGMLPEAERAADRLFEEHDVVAEIICPVQLYPLNLWPIIESVHQSGRLLVVEEGLGFAAFSAEVIAQLCERAPGVLQKVCRLASRSHPIPASRDLENDALPTTESIVATAADFVKAS
jgi:2-oxoisovalerate dehydrogenase E1 component